MDDFFYSGRLESYHLAFAYAVTTRTVETAVLNHDCDPVGAHLLGRGLTAGLLAAATLQPKARLNVRWAYEGALKTLVVDAGPDGTVRGLISPAQLEHAASSSDLFGPDTNLSVVRSEDGIILSSGTVKAGFQDVVEDFAFFLCISDQVESALQVLIGLSSQPEHPISMCRGLLLQALPGCDLALFNEWRTRLGETPVRALMSRDEESDNHLENILRKILGDPDGPLPLHLDALPPPRFACACSMEKMGAVLRALPYDERMDLVKKGEAIRVRCHFCGKVYELSIDDCIREWNARRNKSA